MPKDATAPAAEAPAEGVSERDYQALLATLSASTLGRAFLAEFARRQHLAETDALLAAVKRLEAMVAAQQAPAATPATPRPAASPVRLSVVAPPPTTGDDRAPASADCIPEVTWFVEVEPPAPPQPVAPAVADEPPAAPVAGDEDEAVAAELQAEVPPVADESEMAAISLEWPMAASLSDTPPSGDTIEAPPPGDETEPSPPSEALEPAAAPSDTALPATPLPANPYEQLLVLTEEERIALFS